MTEQFDGGRLVVEVVGDTTGLSRRLQAQVDAATANVKAKIAATIDARQAVRDAQRELRAANLSVKAAVTFDTAQIRRDLRAALDAAQAAAKVTVGVDADTTEARRKLDELGATRKRVTVTADADTTKAEAQVEEVRRRESGKNITLDVVLKESGDFGSTVLGLAKFPALAAGAAELAAAVAQVGAALGAVAAAAAPALGALAAIPAAFGVIAQGVGTLFAGFSGLGAALKDLDKADTASAKSSAAAAAQREAAAVRIRNAHEAVAKAQQHVGDVEQEVARQVQEAEQRVADAVANVAVVRQESARRLQEAALHIADAERGVTAAQQDELRAQQALNQARADATRQLEDMNRQLKNAPLDAEAAQLAVEEARARLDQVNKDPKSTDLQRREAALALKQALADQEEVRVRNGRLATDVAKANKAGVEGSAQVVSAKDNVIAAQQREADAVASLARAQQAYRDTQIQNARDIAKAQREVLTAQQRLVDVQTKGARQLRDAQQGVAAAQQNLADALNKSNRSMATAAASAAGLYEHMNQLGPAGQRFVRFLKSTVVPALQSLRRAAQEALLPGLQAAISRSMVLLPIFRAGIAATAKVFGDTAQAGAKMMTTGPWRADLRTILGNNVTIMRNLGGASLSIADALRNIVVAAGPFLITMSQWVAQAAAATDKFLAAKRASGELATFFDAARDSLAQLGRIFGNVALGMIRLLKLGMPAGQGLLDSFEKATRKFRDLTNSAGTRNKVKEYFDNAATSLRAVGKLIDAVVLAFFDLGSSKTTAPLIDQIRTKLLPAITDVLKKLQTGDLGKNLIDLLTNLVNLLGSLLGSGGGGLNGFVKTLNGMVTGLQAVLGFLDSIAGKLSTLTGLAVPGGTDILSTVLELAGAAAAVGLVAGYLGKIAGAVTSIGKVKNLGSVLGGLFGRGATGGKGGGLGGTASKLLGTRVFWGPEPLPVVVVDGGLPGLPGGGKGKIGSKVGTVLKKIPGATTVTTAVKWAVETLSLGALMKAMPSVLRVVASRAVALPVTVSLAGLEVAHLIRGGSWIDMFLKDGLGLWAPGTPPRYIYNIGADVVSGIWNGITDGATALGNSIKRWVTDSLEGPFRSALGALSPSRLFMAVGADIVAGLVAGITGGIGAVVTALVNPVVNAASSLPGALSRAWSAVSAGASTAWSGISATVSRWLGVIGSSVSSAASGIGTRLASAWSSVTAGAAAGWAAVSRTVSSWLGVIGTSVSSAASGIGTRLASAWNSVTAGAAAGWAAVSRTVSSWLTNIRNAVNSAALYIGSRLASAWNSVTAGAAAGWAAVTRTISSWLTNIRNGVSTAATAVTSRLSTAWQTVWGDATRWWTRLSSWLGTTVTNIKNGMSTTVLNLVRELSTLWQNVYNDATKWVGRVQSFVGQALNAIKQAFSSAVTSIGASWGGLRQATGGPTQFVVNKVYQNGIRSVWEQVSKLFGGIKLPDLNFSFARGGVLPGYSPGVDNLLGVHRPTGSLVGLSGGEGILVPEAVRGLASAMGTSTGQAINSINAAFTSRVTGPTAGFSTGGLIGGFAGGGVVNFLEKAGSVVVGKIGSLVSGAKNWVLGGLASAVGAAVKPLRDAIRTGLSGNVWKNNLGGAANNVIDSLIGLLREKDAAASGGGGVGASGQIFATYFWDPTTASGPMTADTVASPSWPLGTVVDFTHGGRRARGTVRDFGPADFVLARNAPWNMVDLATPLSKQLFGTANNGLINYSIAQVGSGATYKGRPPHWNSKWADMAGIGPTTGALGRALAFARAQVGKPYGWGAVGPGSFDCSGFLSALINVAHNTNPFHRLFSTSSMPAGGLAEGLRSAFMVGWTRDAGGGVGHTAGTIGGVNVESRGGIGPIVGSRARGWNDRLFNRWAGLRGFARGGIVGDPKEGDPPFDLIDPRGKRYQADARKRLAALVGADVFDTGGWMGPGLGLHFNGTGTTEAVLTGRQWDSVHTLARVAARALRTAGPDHGYGGVTIHPGAITQNIYNPTPETPSQTANVRLRTMAASGLFGAKPK